MSPASSAASRRSRAFSASSRASRPALSEAAIQQGLVSFPGLAHRMEQVGRKDNVLFVNDSKATNADAAARARELHRYFLDRWRARQDRRN